ncbi:putative transporter SEO1 [Wickerhamomyces ciferrii]|uniref:Transporter SEO1 n=1 Tax=Wickerhamomyces ciferrii (strain ATCC 14091 / BCRC 22168 / CBS 111 / JCM 3599 / NBRC 0793 / NRRL Y-1031 F-60-10) TaxID=1206466 RepID=K0KNP0_WICCF|nr:putative transporter SEO1 [Wickerhamomyces ciferrii]CCH44611.1 putative transporter SEO1 [Wickerhamomyces ciferrii]
MTFKDSLLKWYPTLRHVEDYPEDIGAEISNKDQIAGNNDQKLDIDASVLSVDTDNDSTPVEYRDEANRPWWKFFDEYEYRYNRYETKRHKWWLWFEEGTSKEEKKLLFKLDILVAGYVFMVYWVKSLDSSNISNAYVSNMKEDLNFQGNDYVNTVTVFNVSSVIFQIPAMYLFPRFPLHLYFPILDAGWGLFTLFSYKVQNVGQIQAMRFFVGAFESGFYAAVHYILVSSSGLFQAAVFRNLDGANGLAGWRWMFIVDAVCTLPLALIGFLFVPGTPYSCYSIWLTDDEIRLARRRLKKANITPPSAKPPNFLDKDLWKRVLKTWKLYVLTLFSIGCWNSSTTAGSGYILWLKSLKRYSIPQVNDLSIIAPLIGIILITLVCGGADVFRSRSGAIICSSILNFVSCLILLIWDVPEGAKWFGFAILYAGWASASVIYSFCNDILRKDPQERAITFILLYSISQSTNVWIVKLIWPTVDAPRYTVGYGTTLAFVFYLIIVTLITLYYYKRDEERIARENGIVLYNSQTGDIPPEVKAHLNKTQGTELTN